MTNYAELIAELDELAKEYKACVSGDAKDDLLNYNWSDKPHRVLYDACDKMNEAAAALRDLTEWRDRKAENVPDDPWYAFAYLVSRCGEGFGGELMRQGRTDTQARNAVIGCLLDFAAGEACRVARKEGREPDHSKWKNAADDAFERAVKRTHLPHPKDAG